MSLSNRAKELSEPDPKFMFWDILQDLWHPEDNPGGFVSLGLAENSLMHDNLSAHIHEHMALPNDALTYGDGKKRLRRSVAAFLTRHLAPAAPVEPAHVTVANGCSSAIEHAAWAFGDPGDSFLLGRPYYGTFVPDVTLRMGTKLIAVDFGGKDPLGLGAVRDYEDAILKAQRDGGRVAGLILCHPHNPLGRCYPRPVLVEFMKLCQKYQVHLISDEIYALSTFTNTYDASAEEASPFVSILSIDPAGVIDGGLVHAVWGVSKDFGANGLRLGALVSQHNPDLHAALVPVSLYSSSSAVTDHIVANFLDDRAWVERYISENRRQLAANYEHVAAWANDNDVPYAPGVNAAFFLWVNLGAAWKKRHPGADDGGNRLRHGQTLKNATEVHRSPPLVVDDGAALRAPQVPVVQHDHVIAATLGTPVVLAFIGDHVMRLCLHMKRGRLPSPSLLGLFRDQRKKLATLLVAQRAKPGAALMAPAPMMAVTALLTARPVRMLSKSIALLLS